MYQCSFCKKEYETATERARCELACDRELKKQTEEERKQKLLQEKQTRYDEIKTLHNTLQDKIAKYQNDYNEIILVDCFKNADNLRRIFASF